MLEGGGVGERRPNFGPLSASIQVVAAYEGTVLGREAGGGSG